MARAPAKETFEAASEADATVRWENSTRGPYFFFVGGSQQLDGLEIDDALSFFPVFCPPFPEEPVYAEAHEPDGEQYYGCRENANNKPIKNLLKNATKKIASF